MMNLSATQAISLLVGSLVLAGPFGCAHTPARPAPVADAVMAQLGTIGLVVQPTAQEAMFHAPDTGMGANAGRGAGNGTMLLQGAGVCGFLFIVCIPGLAILGAMGGAVYGAAASEPAAQWREAESTFRAILEEIAVADRIPAHLVPYAQQHGFEMRVIPRHIPQDHAAGPPYAALAQEGIDTVLELSELRVSLAPAAFVVNPPRRLVASVRIRLIRTSDGVRLDDRTITYELAGTRSLNAWTEDHAQAFRKNVNDAAQRLAEQLIEEPSLREPLQDRCEGVRLDPQVCFDGPKPLARDSHPKAAQE